MPPGPPCTGGPPCPSTWKPSEPTSTPVERSWSSTDCLLYALGVGAGSLDAIDFELEYTTENSVDRPQQVLPTFAAVVGGGGPPRTTLGSFDLAMLVHGEQSIELFGPHPARRDGAHHERGDRHLRQGLGRGGGVGVHVGGRRTAASRGSRATTSLFIRGEGGFGGRSRSLRRARRRGRHASPTTW